ncbi:hypothetical protein DSO57_1035944 [Entomophthora muscae]|uniref:Uncharacterized protein n=1 Tax=Entomophthora muscae TaxID=34485 RepID=A0ACC2TAE5_9FUNG|nr:hypothetical protein DSO57_1035944 [Entomophthora muscae]
MRAAEEYLEAQLKEFQFEGQGLSVLQQGTVSNIVKSVLYAWATPGVTKAQPVSWKTSENFEQRLWQAFQEVLKSYKVEGTAHLVPMVMAGNLVLRDQPL